MAIPFLSGDGAGGKLTPWTVATLVLACIFLVPVLFVFITAIGDSGGLWAHLFSTVVPRYVTNTLVLMFGVALVTLAFGLSSAWAVVRYEFPGRRIFEWMLLLPAAVPAYLIAYVYTDFLEFAGPVQKSLRNFFGWQNINDYWFPEIRSMEGAMLVMGAVLYPYVYVMARTAFLLTPATLFEVGILARRNLFWTVALPLARPAIAAGLALAIMETISDFGTVEYFAIETLTLGIFNVWLGMNNLTAAAQIATFAFLFIIVLLVAEIVARSRRRFSDTTQRAVPLAPTTANGWSTIVCWTICFLPILIGFLLPLSVLTGFIIQGYSVGFSNAVVMAALNSVFLATTVAVLVMLSAAFMGFVANFQAGPIVRLLTSLAATGYAFPGTILAIGVVGASGAADSGIESLLSGTVGIAYEGLLSTGVGLVIFACIVRFQAIGYGAVKSGLDRLSPNMMAASRMLGHGFVTSIWRVILPLIRASLVAGGLLVFVDVMKELPMTLLLRPFNYETLPTYVYQFAKDELLEEAALPALIIVFTGIIPVMLMNSVLNRFTRI